MEGRFQILSTLAAGGRGTLYRAWDKTRNCDVALKRPRAAPGAREEIERESRRLYALRHPGIARVLDYGEDAEGPFLVLELIQGETLEARLGKGLPGMADFRALVERTLEGIGAAHEAGLLHLDLKAENIMLPWAGGAAQRAVLVDFGLSREPGPAGAEAEGSVHGMAPEQFSGGEVDARTDLYALGVVYYQALTGRLPFQGETKPQVITAHLRHAMTPLQELRPDLSPELCAWVEGLLSVNPDERPASAEAALRAFQSIPLEERPLEAGAVAESVLPVLEDEEAAGVLPGDEEEYAAPVLMAAAVDEAGGRGAEPEAALAADVDEVEAVAVVEAAPAGRAPPARASATAPPVTPSPQPQRAARGRMSLLQVIIAAFVIILLAQLALVSWFKHSGREERAARFAELAALESPAGSDLDVRLLLDFLGDPSTQESAAAVLARLQGGEYIDEMLRAHLRKISRFPACVPLIEVIGRRRDGAAFEDLLPFLEDSRTSAREAAWTALGGITPPEKLPAVLRLVPKATTREHALVEKFLAAAVGGADERDAAIAQVVRAYRAAPPESPQRALFFNAIIRIGGAGTLEVVTEAIADPAEKIRRAAITQLASFPAHDPLPAIAARFPHEPDETCRAYLLLAAIELVERPGPLSQQALHEHAQSLYGHARDNAERRYVLSLMSRVIAPGTAAFFERLAGMTDAPLRQDARQLARAFRDKLETVIKIAPGSAPTTLPAAEAAYRLGGRLTHRDGALAHWSDTADWASWLVEIPAAGDYEILIHQAHAGLETGTYEVLLAGQVLPAAVVVTGAEFKGFILGTVAVPAPGIYKVFLRPRKLPASGPLFEVRSLGVKGGLEN